MGHLSDNETSGETIKPFHYYEEQHVSTTYHFYLCGEIASPAYYVDMIHCISSAGPGDTVHVHLNTSGGHLGTGIQIVNAIQNSQAHVICSVESESHSLGTLIFLAADEFVIHDNCMMMFHNFSGMTCGKGNEQLAQVTSMTNWFAELAEKFYTPFLTQQEIDDITNGKNLWLRSDQIKQRLSKVNSDSSIVKSVA